MGRLSRAVPLLLAAGLLAGCGTQTATPAAEPAATRTPVPSITALETPAPPSYAADPATCDGVPLRVEVLGLDAAAGHRYLALQLTNCGSVPLVLDDVPTLSLTTDGGRTKTPRTDVWEQRPAVTVAPGGSAYAGLEYLVGDLDPAAASVSVTVDGVTSTLSGPLDLDAWTPITIYPWVPDTSRIWAS